MHSFLQLGALAALVGLAAATPSPLQQRAPQATIDPSVPEYYLKTEVVSGDATKDGLYVEAYHTAAGFNDAVLVDSTASASKGYLNGTESASWLFNLNTEYPWGLVLSETDIYSEWDPVQINAGGGSETLSLDSNGNLIGETYYEWTGWVACDWSKGVPQLFWRYYYTDITLPSTCALVNLVPVPVDA